MSGLAFILMPCIAPEDFHTGQMLAVHSRIAIPVGIMNFLDAFREVLAFHFEKLWKCVPLFELLI